MDTGDLLQNRLAVIFRADNPGLYARLLARFYTGPIDKKTTVIDGADLRNLAYLNDEQSTLAPHGCLAEHLLKTLRLGLGIAPCATVTPDVACMRLVDLTAASFTPNDPTLVFYIDVPVGLVPLMTATLFSILGLLADPIDLIHIRVVAFQVQAKWAGVRCVLG